VELIERLAFAREHHDVWSGRARRRDRSDKGKGEGLEDHWPLRIDLLRIYHLPN
jgi:hypothetical protein